MVNAEGNRHNGSLLVGLMDYFERHLPHVVRRISHAHAVAPLPNASNPGIMPTWVGTHPFRGVLFVCGDANVAGPIPQGFFQPIAATPFPQSTSGLPSHVELMRNAFQMRGDPEAMSAVTRCATCSAPPKFALGSEVGGWVIGPKALVPAPP